MDGQDVLSFRVAGPGDREAVLRLPSERWQETDTLGVEYPHIVGHGDKWGYVCCRNGNAIVGFIAVYLGKRGREIVLLHRRFSSGGYRALEVMRGLLAFAVQDISACTDCTVEELVLTVPGDSYAIIKNSFLRAYTPLFTRKSLMLRGNLSYVLSRVASLPQSTLMFIGAGHAFNQLLSQHVTPGVSQEKIAVRGDPISLEDLMQDRLPFQGVRPLMTFSRRAGLLGGLSVGTVKMDSQNDWNVLHIDIHTGDMDTLQAHVVEHITQWAEGWRRNKSFYLEINYNDGIDVGQLYAMAGRLGMMPRDECAIKTLISLQGHVSALNIAHQNE